jgi:hypothetical protein
MPTATFEKMSIEGEAYRRFMFRFDGGLYPCQRYGQAFYNEFRLHKMNHQDVLQGLYELDGSEAEAKIKELFELH